MMEKILRWMLTMLFCVLSLTMWSQDAHVVGHISDENNQPMPFVSIQIKGTTLGGLSDETGHYFLKDLPVGNQTLVISCVGLEYTYNRLHDKMLGYNRDLLQKVNIVGGYLQNEWKNEQVSILLGARLEKHNLLKNVVFSPRANFRYTPVNDVILRLTYASGYRAPQAYTLLRF